MAAYYTSNYTATDHQSPLCVLETGSPVNVFAPAYSDAVKPPTSLPFVSKTATVAVATARAEPPAPAANRGVGLTTDADDARDADAEDAKAFFAFADKHFPKEQTLYAALKKAKKALKNCTDAADETVLRGSYKKAKAAHTRYFAKVEAAYDKHLREEAREYASDSDYAPSQSDAEEEPVEAEADAYYALSDVEEEPEEDAVEDDAPAPKKNSKRKFTGPAVGPVKKAARAKPGSKPQRPLPGGCGCSCGGVRCGHATETPEIRYDKSTQRPCCNTCGVQQYKAMNFLFGTKNPGNEVATKSVCWLNQCEAVRVLGLGGGRRVKNRKAASAAAAAVASEDEEQKSVVESAATAGDGEHHEFNFDDERFLSFVKSNYEEETRLRDEWTSAKREYDACAKGSLKSELKRAYEDAKDMHVVLLREARLVYIATEPDAAGAAEGAVGETPSKAKKRRSKPNTKGRLTMGEPCGCSCEGAHCGFDRTTSENRYDLTTQRRCCNACRLIQNKAMKWLDTKDRTLHFATRKACWLNQSEGVRELGLGGGRQHHQRKALPIL